MLTCPSVKYLHMQCPGCGIQRSFIALLNGDLKQSAIMYPALIPLMLLLVFFVLHLRYQFVFGKKVIILLQTVAVLLITGQYIYKIATNQIFQTI